ncbi:MAG: lysin, 1,4-beta-N-acetylmuramidase or lysozyme (endogenous virus) [Lactobacillus phage ViSo-2018b]|nr:MAG: lysin, 1,4-beta-N-acetylmuramidase or lysozyme [Lactobacillus phage ViSo-2018b]
MKSKASKQVASSRANHMYTHAYHFARFGSSVSQAKREADYFIKEAKGKLSAKSGCFGLTGNLAVAM